MRWTVIAAWLLVAAPLWAQLEIPRETPTDQVVSFQVADVPTGGVLETRVFYTGALGWIFRAATFGSLSMRGFDTTPFGGTIESVTGCFYNESSFSRRFVAEFSVQQFGQTLEAIEFGTTFPSERFHCHRLTGFATPVEPGEFEVVVFYDRSRGDNFWAALSATTSGQVFDVQIGSQRPPTVAGTQGPEDIHGVGIEYQIEFNDSPPPVLPVADFSFTVSDLRVDFQNHSLNATSYHWDFGDLSETSLSDPFHVYRSAGTYEVSLTAINAFGSDSIAKSVSVMEEEPPPPPDVLEFGPIASVLNGRFRIEVFYDTSTASGQALGAVYQDTSSFWHFFGEENIEIFAKVLNACGITGNYWVFAAGATNVGVEIRVTDTQTGAVRTYINPVNRTFVTVTDTGAFPCF